MADETFLEKLERQKKKYGFTEPEPTPAFDPDLIPDDPYEGLERENLKDHVTVLEGYQKYISPSKDGFMPHYRASQKESIKVRCPNPNHTDKNPSAWVNTDKDVIYCAVCDQGFDLFDLAAIFYGYPVPNYKTDKELFKRLRDQIAEDFGITVRPGLAGPKISRAVDSPAGSPGLEGGAVSASQPDKTAGQGQDAQEPAKSEPTVLAFPTEPPEEPTIWPTVDFEALGIWGTFLGNWVRYSQEIDQTPEYFLSSGFMAIGFAVGRNAILADGYPGIRPNTMVCIVAPSGIGKSRSIEQFQSLLDSALPDDDPSIHGVQQFITPGSGETIIDYFAQKKDTGDPIPIKGLIEFNEFSDMSKRAGRSSSTMESTIMKFYDQHRPIGRGTVGMKVKAVDHHLAIMTSTQPRLIRRYLSREQVDSGFVGRWSFACGEPRVLPSRLAVLHPPPKVIEQLQEIYEFYETRKIVLEYTPEALSLWDEFYHDQIAPLKRDISTSSIYSRLDLHCKKNMSLFAYNDLAERLERSHVESAIAHYPYLYRTLEFVQGNIGVSEVDDCAEAIEKYIEGRVASKKPNPTPHEIRKAVQNRHDIELIKRTLEVMEKLEMVEYRQDARSGKAGPKTLRVYLHA